MTCINWVRTDAQTDYLGKAAVGNYQEDGGYMRWANGQKVKFWWFDGRNMKIDTSEETPNSWTFNHVDKFIF